MNTLFIRFKAAWAAFHLRSFEAVYGRYKNRGKVVPYACDFSGDYLNGQKADWYAQVQCHNKSEVCMGRSKIEIQINQDEHLHICGEHEQKVIQGQPVSRYD